MQYKTFMFNPVQENTYLLWDQTGECVFIDPGNLFPDENEKLRKFVEDQNLKPVKIINTHGHFDHSFGVRYLADTFHIGFVYHREDKFLIDNLVPYAKSMGLPFNNEAPEAEYFLNEGDIFTYGHTQLKLIHVPGHSPGSLAFYNHEHHLLFSGDVLFRNSIGRTDLPSGDYNQLIKGIKEKLFSLPDETVVLPGHGPSTTIDYEKKNNPFLK